MDGSEIWNALSSRRPMVVFSTFNSYVNPVNPSLSTTSLAIGLLIPGIILGVCVKSNCLSAERRSFVAQSASSMSFNQNAEFIEQRGGVVRAGRRFRMVLHAENRLRLVAHTFDGLIV